MKKKLIGKKIDSIGEVITETKAYFVKVGAIVVLEEIKRKKNVGQRVSNSKTIILKNKSNFTR